MPSKKLRGDDLLKALSDGSVMSRSEADLYLKAVIKGYAETGFIEEVPEKGGYRITELGRKLLAFAQNIPPQL